MRYHRTFGLDAEQLDELEARIEDILLDPWHKETGHCPLLPGLLCLSVLFLALRYE